VDAFVQMMNDKAAALGCRDTNFTNVTGLHDKHNYTTARDLCRITEAALENDHFQGVFSAAEYTVGETNKSDARFIQTSNLMMSGKKYQDDRVTGGKAGNTKEGGRCLTVTAKSGDMDVLCIVMGAKATYVDDVTLSAHGSYEECKILLDYAFKTFEYRQVFFEGQVISQYPVTDGANDVVSQPVNSASTVLPADADTEQLRWVYLDSNATLTAPVDKGQKLGAVQVWYGQKCLAETDLVAMNESQLSTPPIVPDRIRSDEGSGSLQVILWVIAVIAVLLLLCMLCLLMARAVRNMSRSARLRRQYRHYRRSRK
jgi:D-alanyl-D-alanine carboxypeptidase (penicillin-binding protein 5/6)